MKRMYVNIVMVILFSASLSSFSYAGSSCCDPGAGCCGTPGISGGQQQAPSAHPSQTKVGTLKKPAPQINPKPWSATINQIGTVPLAPPSASPGCCPATNSTSGCCESAPKPTSHSMPDTAMLAGILTFKPFLGTLW